MRRRAIIILLALAFLLPAADAHARGASIGRIRADKTLGLGVGTGTFASGLSLKSFTGDTSFQFNIGSWGPRFWDEGYHNDGFAVSFDVLAEMPALARSDVLRLGWSMGVGAGTGVNRWADMVGVAGAFVLGLEFELQPVPIDFVIEWRPKVGLLAYDDVAGVGVEPVDFTGHVRIYLF